MSSRQRGASVKDTWKLKKWYRVMAPRYFGNMEIGMTPALSPELLVGRVMETSLYNITGDFSQAHVLLYFQIYDVKGDQAYTMFKGHSLTRDYLRSLIRRGTSKVEGIFTVTTKDGYKIRITIDVFTRTRIKTSHEKEIRKIMERIVENTAKTLTFEQFVREAVLGKIASEIYNDAKKIVPLRRCEVQKTKVLYPKASELLRVMEEAKEEKEKEKAESEDKEAEEIPSTSSS
ncbi:MAG: 30S ribosomal protein S3ae [Candidatus Asgardarchaeia archaeon]